MDAYEADQLVVPGSGVPIEPWRPPEHVLHMMAQREMDSVPPPPPGGWPLDGPIDHDRVQYGREMPNGLVIATAHPEPTHYRQVGPWITLKPCPSGIYAERDAAGTLRSSARAEGDPDATDVQHDPPGRS